jgi:mannose-1-phosphate guanylyltransferase
VDPTRFGVVELRNANLVKRFIEKPRLEDVPSKLINAGVYVLEHSVLDYIPLGRQVSMEREVFPVMTASNQLYGHRFQGLWVDTGKPNDYFLANKLMLDTIAGNAP